MRRLAHGLLALLAGTLVASGQEPPPPDEGSNPPPVPVPASTPVPAAPVESTPLLVAIPTGGFLRPDQAAFGSVLPPSPAQGLAMMEAGRPLFPNDPAVAAAAILLTQATAGFIEDAPRIAELTARVVGEIRAANQPASPFEMLVGSTQWKRPPRTRGDVPRKFEEFAALYRKLRKGEGKDHATALSLMQPAPPAIAPNP